MDGVLSNFWYWLNSNVWVSSEGIPTPQKSLFSDIALWNFLFRKNEDNSNDKNHYHILKLFLLIMKIILLLQDNAFEM